MQYYRLKPYARTKGKNKKKKQNNGKQLVYFLRRNKYSLIRHNRRDSHIHEFAQTVMNCVLRSQCGAAWSFFFIPTFQIAPTHHYILCVKKKPSGPRKLSQFEIMVKLCLYSMYNVHANHRSISKPLYKLRENGVDETYRWTYISRIVVVKTVTVHLSMYIVLWFNTAMSQ